MDKMEYLIHALETIWTERQLKRVHDWAQLGCVAGVGGPHVEQLVRMEDLKGSIRLFEQSDGSREKVNAFQVLI
jgi:hypothetical protein